MKRSTKHKYMHTEKRQTRKTYSFATVSIRSKRDENKAYIHAKLSFNTYYTHAFFVVSFVTLLSSSSCCWCLSCAAFLNIFRVKRVRFNSDDDVIVMYSFVCCSGARCMLAVVCSCIYACLYVCVLLVPA